MKTIMLVDDTNLTLAMGKRCLEAAGFRVITARTGADALGILDSVKPDLLILDYEMPGMNGDAVCQALHRRPSGYSTPVLILTAHTSPDVQLRCRSAGASDLLNKQAGMSDLLRSVAKLLDLPERRHMRVPCQVKAGIQGTDHAGSYFMTNISEGGAYLVTKEAMKGGEYIDLTFNLPLETQSISVRGEVMRSESLANKLYGYGIQFIEIDNGSKIALRQFVENSV